jgi:hypothetical protein
MIALTGRLDAAVHAYVSSVAKRNVEKNAREWIVNDAGCIARATIGQGDTPEPGALLP